MRELLSIFLLFIILIITSCQKELSSSGSTTTIIISGLVSRTVGAGGTYIMGIASDGTAFGQRFTVGTEKVLANGEWIFYALTWTGPESMHGTLKCSKLNKELTGGQETLQMQLLTNCSDADFGNARYKSSGVFLSARFLSCDSLIDFSNGFSCTANMGQVKSAQVTLFGYSGTNISPILSDASGIQSSCISYGGNNGVTTTFRFPVGTTNIPFPVKLELFSDSSCSSSIREVQSSSGLEEWYQDSSGNLYIDSDGTNLLIGTKDDVAPTKRVLEFKVRTGAVKLTGSNSNILDVRVAPLYQQTILKNGDESILLNLRIENAEF